MSELGGLWIQIDILWPAFLAGILVVATHVPLGQEVLRRGIIFLDLAIAQVAGFGLIAANTLGIDNHEPHARQIIAIATAVIASLLLYRLRKRAPEEQEALIGIVFVLAATGSILLLASNPHGGERLRELLVGQILWVNYGQLVSIAAVYFIVLVVWFAMRSSKDSWVFYPLFAITITLSTQLVGVYLVFASLIIPALAVKHLFGWKALVWGYGTAFTGYVLGLLFSAWKDIPSGATIAWSLAMAGFVGGVLSRQLSHVASDERVDV